MSVSDHPREELLRRLSMYVNERGLALNPVVIKGREELRIGLRFQSAKRLKGVVARLYVTTLAPAVRAYSRLPVAEASRFAPSQPVIDPSMRSLTFFAESLSELEAFLDSSLRLTRQLVLTS